MSFRSNRLCAGMIGKLILPALLLGLALGGCTTARQRTPKGSVPAEAATTTATGDVTRQTPPALPAFAKDVDTTTGRRLGVNSFLWRGALDTVSFMPLVSADPFGGVIITDWYAPPETPKERFKLNIYILGRELRADGVRVAVFHQKEVGGQWQDVQSDKATATDLEDTILSRAERLRNQQYGTGG
jgi:hypothetical protein